MGLRSIDTEKMEGFHPTFHFTSNFAKFLIAITANYLVRQIDLCSLKPKRQNSCLSHDEFLISSFIFTYYICTRGVTEDLGRTWHYIHDSFDYILFSNMMAFSSDGQMLSCKTGHYLLSGHIYLTLTQVSSASFMLV
jgi:hypothetical protein